MGSEFLETRFSVATEFPAKPLLEFLDIRFSVATEFPAKPLLLGGGPVGALPRVNALVALPPPLPRCIGIRVPRVRWMCGTQPPQPSAAQPHYSFIIVFCAHPSAHWTRAAPCSEADQQKNSSAKAHGKLANEPQPRCEAAHFTTMPVSTLKSGGRVSICLGELLVGADGKATK